MKIKMHYRDLTSEHIHYRTRRQRGIRIDPEFHQCWLLLQRYFRNKAELSAIEIRLAQTILYQWSHEHESLL